MKTDQNEMTVFTWLLGIALAFGLGVLTGIIMLTEPIV